MPIFWRILIKNRFWILSKTFPASIFLKFYFIFKLYIIVLVLPNIKMNPPEVIIWFLSFNLLIWCITLFDLHILKNPCIPGINPTCHGVWAFWCVVEFCMLKFCWGFLHLCSSVMLACSFIFVCCLCWILGWWWPCRMNLEVFLPLQFFERVLEG